MELMGDERRRRRDDIELIKYKIENEEFDEIHVFKIGDKQASAFFSCLNWLGEQFLRFFASLLQNLLPVVVFLSLFVFILFAVFLVSQLVFGKNPLFQLTEKEVEFTDDDMFIPAHVCVIALIATLLAYAAYAHIPAEREEFSGGETNVDALKKLLDARESSLNDYGNVNNFSYCKLSLF